MPGADSYSMKIDPSCSAVERRERLERDLHIKLPAIGSVQFAEKEPVHCENLIGGTVIPLGVAGPLKLEGETAKGEFFIPLATTEGALVASVNRGCKAISMSGGAVVRAEKTGVTRSPVFDTASLPAAFKLRDWLERSFARLQKEAETTSSHLKLRKMDTKITGRYVFARFYFDTGEAMGMNMVTIASDRLAGLIADETRTTCVSLSGNYCVDKKPSYLNFITGRGLSGWAEVTLTRTVMESVFKTTAQQVFDVWMGKSVMGSIASGTLGNNAHFANIVAAFFAATGQDLAHVVEGSMGITTAKVMSGGTLYFSVYLPAMMLGMVGGGTKLAIKKEALSILGVKSVLGLAELLAGTVLAGELSLMASLAEGTLAFAHTRLGR